MAYTTATLIQKDPPTAQNTVHLIAEFTGAGETAVRRELDAPPTTTLASLRQWARDQAAALDARRGFLDTITVGQSISLTPPVPPVPTAKQIWQGKVSRYKQYAGAGLTGAGATALAALLTDINATYAAGFLDD